MGDAVLHFTKNAGQFGVVIAILVTMGAVAGEKGRGTAVFLLTKPITRGAFLGAKIVAVGVLLALSTCVAGVLCWAYSAILFEPLPIAGYVLALVLVWLSLAVFAAVIFLDRHATTSATVRMIMAGSTVGGCYLGSSWGSVKV